MRACLGIVIAAPFLLFFSRPARASEPVMFPLPDELFHRLLADPRQAQTELSYYRLSGANNADVALAHTWGLLRWQDVGAKGRDVQWNIEGMAYSRFRVSGGINQFETVDYFANVPVEAKFGAWSGRATLFHQSSHLGDDHIRRTGDTGYRYSVEGLRIIGSFDANPFLRLYAGPMVFLHSIPRNQKGSLQMGFEANSPDLGWFSSHSSSLYFAQDFTSQGRRGWNVDSNTEAGLRLGFPAHVRALRVHADYFAGHSPFGQFYNQTEHYLSLGMSFDF